MKSLVYIKRDYSIKKIMHRIYKLHSDGTSLERLVKIGENIKNIGPLGKPMLA